MKNTVINTTLGLIALATMTFAAGGAQANHDNSERYGQRYGQHQSWNERGRYVPQHAQRESQQRLAQIDARQAMQKDRIQNGLQSHVLRHREFRALRAEQNHIRGLEHEFMADGFLSPFEFQQLDRALDMAGRNIRMEKRDYHARSSFYGNHRYGDYRSAN